MIYNWYTKCWIGSLVIMELMEVHFDIFGKQDCGGWQPLEWETHNIYGSLVRKILMILTFGPYVQTFYYQNATVLEEVWFGICCHKLFSLIISLSPIDSGFCSFIINSLLLTRIALCLKMWFSYQTPECSKKETK